MKNTIFIAISLLLFYIMACKTEKSTDVVLTAGKATLAFQAQQDEITVHIYKPIDDTYNNRYITDKFVIKPDTGINFELDVNGFAFVKCEFSNGRQGMYLLFPGDYVGILPGSQRVSISGDNAEGHKYLNDNYFDYYNHRGFGSFASMIRRYVGDTVPRNGNTVPIKLNYDSVYNFFQQEIIMPYQNDLKQMEAAGSITPQFSSVLSTNLYMGLSFIALLNVYENLVRQILLPNRERFILYEEEAEDVRSLLLQMEKLYETTREAGDDVRKMWSNPVGYFRVKYLSLDEKEKEKLMEGYDIDTFGNAAYLLLASDSLQLKHFSEFLIYDLQNIRPSYNFNQEKLLAYLSNKFPDSESVALINQLMAKTLPAETEEIVFVVNSPASIKEMMQLIGIKGNYAYIDLWGTWCPPCIAEFKHNDEIHKLLAQYNNIVPVYIAIDDEKEGWENGVKQFNLKGYHILASKSLNGEIGEKVYHAKEIGAVPRYLLLDPAGNIVNDNLPRKNRIMDLNLIFAGIQK